MLPHHLFPRLASGALALAMLSSCEALRPADVCLAEETLATTKQILQQTILPQGDTALLQQAFDEVLTIELVTFEGYDRQTRRVSCSARLASTQSTLTAITYTRTPEVGTDRYIYGVNFEGNPAAPAYLLLSRYRELETQLYASPAEAAPPSANLPSTEPQEAPRAQPTQAGDVEGFPLGHRSAGALLASLENVDTAAALMTGRMTQASARRFCSYARYFDFSGRSDRTEYWWFCFSFWLLVASGGLLDLAFLGSAVNAVGEPTGVLAPLALLVSLIPSLGVTVRRLHDTGRSGWWCLIGLIPVLGFIVMLVWMLSPGTRASNQFGPPPSWREPDLRHALEHVTCP